MIDPASTEAAFLESMALYVDRVGDPAPAIYERFFARYPQAAELFGADEDDYIKMRMIDRLFGLMMEVADGSLQPRFSAFWVVDHLAWTVTRPMMVDMFDIIAEIMREGVGDQWTPGMEQAWHSVIGSIMSAVDANIDDFDEACVRVRQPDLSRLA